MQNEKEKVKAKEGEKLAASSCCDLSVLTGVEWSKHASPVSPQSVSMVTLFLTPTLILYVHLTRFVFPVVSKRLRWTV